MVDLATIEKDVDEAIEVVEPIGNAVIPALSQLPGLGWLSTVWKAIEWIKSQTGKGTPAAVAEFVSHNTPGMPNSPTLSG
jgi:hypothetical protein